MNLGADTVSNPSEPPQLSAAIRHCMIVHARYPLGETRVEREARALADHGYEVDVICLRAEKEPIGETIDGINIYRLPVRRHQGSGLIAQLFEYLAFFVLASIKLAALHRQRHYSAVQAHNLPDWLVFVGLIPRLTGAQVILDLHDLMPEFYAARFNRGLASFPVRLLVWQERVSCRFADHVITVTEAWRDTLITRGVAASKVSVVMNVADDRVFCRLDTGEQPRIDDGHLRLLYHGNLTQRYGVDLAIHAANLLRDQIPNIHLHIHGGGDARQSLIELTDALNLKEQVSFNTRGLLTSELPALIRQADICLVPYRSDVFTDGILPTKLMEYAALGMPAIAARTTAIQAYFSDTNVEFFEPGNVDDLARCIRELHANPDRLAELARGCQKFNQRYNWAEIGAEYVALVERLRSGRGSAGEGTSEQNPNRSEFR